MIDWLADHFDYYPDNQDDDEYIDNYDESECYTIETAEAWQEE